MAVRNLFFIKNYFEVKLQRYNFFSKKSRKNITKEISYIEISRYPNKPSDSAVNEKLRKIHSAHTSSKWSKGAKHWDKAN